MYNFDYSDILEGIGIAVGTLGIIFVISAVVGIALFILQGFGIYRMSKTIGFSNPWISFIPFANIFALGRIAKKYVKRDGSKSAKFNIILLCLYVAEFILSIALIVLCVICIISIISNAELAVETETSMTIEMFYSFIPVIIGYFVLLAVALAYQIVYFVALWRVYSIFDNSNATLYTVLSVFFSFLAPIFLFIISKNNAAFDYKARMGYFEIEQK